MSRCPVGRRWGSFALLCAWLLGSLWPGQAADPTLVGQWPEGPRLGHLRSTTVLPNHRNSGRTYAWLAAGVAGVHIVDVTVPGATRPVAVLDTAGRAEAVAALPSGLVVVADGAAGVVVFDGINPASPRRVGSLDLQGFVADVAAYGIYALAVNRSGVLQVLSVTASGPPVLVGTLPTHGEGSAVVVDERRAYVAGAEGLQVVDLRNPATPRELTFLATRSPANGCAVSSTGSGILAFLVDGSTGLSVVDVTSVSAVKPARLLGRLALGGPAWGVSVGHDPGLVWVANGAKGLTPVDVSNSAQPKLAGGSLDTGGEARRVVVSGSDLYVSDIKGGLRILGVSDPVVPAQATPRGGVPVAGRALGIAVSDTVIALADGAEGLRWLDALHPSRLVDHGYVPLEGGATAVAVAMDSEDIVVVGLGEGSSDVQWCGRPIPGSMSQTPVRRGLYRILDSSFRANGVAVERGRVVVTGGAAGLAILDGRDPDRPRLEERVSVLGGAFGVALSGGLAYVATGSYGLQVVDVREPMQARVLGGTGVPGAGWRAVGVAVSGSRAYVAAENRGLQVVDISDPTRPRIVGNGVESSGVAVGVAAAGVLTFLADGEGGLTVVNVETPEKPRFVGRFDTEGEARSLGVGNEHVFVADDSRVLAFAVPGLTPPSNAPPSFVVQPDPLPVDEDAGRVTVRSWVRDVSPGSGPSERWQAVRFEIDASGHESRFAELPAVDAEGTLRFRLRPDVVGEWTLRVRGRDNGGTANGGRDVTEREVRWVVQPVNDPPDLDPEPELSWRIEPGGLVALVGGLRAGPPDEVAVQRLTLRARSLQPGVLPDPQVEYSGGEQARLVFPGVRDFVGGSEARLALELVDDGGVERGGVDRRTTVRSLRPKVLNEVPRVTILEPGDGDVLPPNTTSVPVRLRTFDEAGLLSLLRFFADQRFVGLVTPTSTDIVWNWEDLGSGMNTLEVWSMDASGLAGVPVLLTVTVAVPPTIESSVRTLDVTEDTFSGIVKLTLRNGIPLPAAPMTPVLTSSDPTKIDPAGISLDQVTGQWVYRLQPVSNAVGSVQIRAVVEGGGGLRATNLVNVRILPVDDPPVVLLEEPAAGSVFPADTEIRCMASAADVDSPIEAVDFVADGVVVGTVRSEPFVFSWAGAKPGPHRLEAVVRGTGGMSLAVTSAPVAIEVARVTNAPPTVVGEGPLTLFRDAVESPTRLVLDDDVTPPERLVVRVESSDPELLPATNLVVRGSGPLRSLVVTPARGRWGSARLEITVEDEGGETNRLVIPVTVLAVSELPGGEACFADRVPEGYGTFNLVKLGRYRQGVGGSGGVPESEGATASIELRAPSRYTILDSAVTGPRGLRVLLERREDGAFAWADSGREEELADRLGAGDWNTTYRLSLVPGESFSGFFPFRVVASLPPVPTIEAAALTQELASDLPFFLGWVPWSGAGTNDRVVLTIVDETGREVFTAASDCSGQTVVGRRSGGVEIPAGRLRAGSKFTGLLTFGATQLAVNDRSPLLMLRAYHSRTTRFELRTLAAGQSAPAVFSGARWLAGRLVAVLRGSPRATYRLEVSPDLLTWATVDSRVLPESGTVDMVLPSDSPVGSARFYRAVAESGNAP